MPENESPTDRTCDAGDQEGAGNKQPLKRRKQLNEGDLHKIMDNNSKLGRGKLGKNKWPYMAFFDNMFGKEPATEPVCTCKFNRFWSD